MSPAAPHQCSAGEAGEDLCADLAHPLCPLLSDSLSSSPSLFHCSPNQRTAIDPTAPHQCGAGEAEEDLSALRHNAALRAAALCNADELCQGVVACAAAAVRQLRRRPPRRRPLHQRKERSGKERGAERERERERKKQKREERERKKERRERNEPELPMDRATEKRGGRRDCTIEKREGAERLCAANASEREGVRQVDRQTKEVEETKRGERSKL